MSTQPNAAEKERELAELRARVAELEAEISPAPGPAQWPPRQFYATYYATTGAMLGMFGAATSLLFNIVGSLIVNQHPLRLIQVYLTFPLGARAMAPDFDNNLALAVGCCLYLATGMALGIPFHLVLSRFASEASLAIRLAWASGLAIAIWLINFYGILSWLQPLLIGADSPRIVDEIPIWVAALTHLVFGWTMAIVYPLGVFTPYRPHTERP